MTTFFITERVIDAEHTDKTGMYPAASKWVVLKQTTSERLARRCFWEHLKSGREVYLTLE